jgi:hypothetical protein
VPAIALAWALADPALSPPVQHRTYDTGAFTSLSGWLLPGATAYVARNLTPTISYRFRLDGLNATGNRNEQFDTIKVDSVV